jgi:hypothetical protein
MREFITFSIKLNGRAPDLHIDEETKKILDKIDKAKLGGNCKNDGKCAACGYDLESIPLLKDYKLRRMHAYLKESVDRKYKISFFKGAQMAYESVILLVLMISVIMKANIFSIIYLLFIFKFLMSRAKT